MIEFQQLDKFQLPPNFRGKSGVLVQVWWLVQNILFKPSPQFMYGWRRWLLRSFGAKVGKGVILRPSCTVTYPWKVEIGDYSWIGDEVVLYSLGNIHIGKNTVISQRSYICTGSHDYSAPHFDIYEKPIHIEDECWLATDVYVAPGIRIGRGAVVGARSSVYKDLPGAKIYVGNPAKMIKERYASVHQFSLNNES
ncbi:putative colanic acid biosynthesis acetyltransferase [Porifericola rhodea]|uniref:putative colanic acid biosynthesis acetyltransferase n=1 Tax=Porifericola rhodea TaxID=930972 RepID=UPI002666960A|nr:putative colanic acid biosynthesis acetyltransferase [Porifericola rhodea]WKN32540.1 putative colanic acid biosynthesis acetyltransferase [Porifericola rhodea]